MFTYLIGSPFWAIFKNLSKEKNTLELNRLNVLYLNVHLCLKYGNLDKPMDDVAATSAKNNLINNLDDILIEAKEREITKDHIDFALHDFNDVALPILQRDGNYSSREEIRAAAISWLESNIDMPTDEEYSCPEDHQERCRKFIEDLVNKTQILAASNIVTNIH